APLRNISIVTARTHTSSPDSTKLARPVAPRRGRVTRAVMTPGATSPAARSMARQPPSPNDGLDHLTKYDAGSSGQERYVYDASGERVLRRSTSSGNTSMTVYAFGLEEHLYSGGGVHQSDIYYYNLGGLLVGESTGSNTNMFLTDALG